MKKQFTISLYLGSLLVFSAGHAADLKQSKFTQVVNDVRVISAADNFEKPAVVNAVFSMPDLVRTGDASRAELVAADDTITRVGANTIFSFDPANRTIDLQQGSLLFHSPKGKGGGTIRTGSATASVLGTTIIVTTTHDGGFKVIDLEGHVAIQFLNGLQQHLAPGQMTFVLPGGNPAPIINIRLDKLTSNSKLVQGFDQPLPSWPLILEQIADQVKLIQTGRAQDTGLLVGGEATATTVQVVRLDPNTIIPSQGDDRPPPTITPPPPGTISGSTLPLAYIVSSPFTAGSFTFPFGFNAPNITINTPTIDLSPYQNVSEFAFVAPNGKLTTKGSVAFNGLSSTAILDLYAQQFSFASGSTMQANVGTFNLYPQTATTLSGVAIVDNAPAPSTLGVPVPLIQMTSSSAPSFPPGGIVVNSPAAFSLTNGSSITAPNIPVHLTASSIGLNKSSVQGSFVGLNGATGVNIANLSTVKATSGNLGILAAGGDIDIDASTLKAVQGASFQGANTGEVFIDAVGGAVNLTNGAAISAADVIAINGNNGVSITGSSINGSSLNLIAATGGAVTLNNSSAQGSSVSLVGATGISLSNGASVASTYGDLNIATTGGSINIGSSSSLQATQGAFIPSGGEGGRTAGDVTLAAIGGMVNVSGGATISAGAVNQVKITSDTGVSISGASTLTSDLSGNGNDIFTTGGAISVTGNSTLNGNTNLEAAAALTVNGATFNAASGAVFMFSDSNSITLQNASITTGYFEANAGDVSGSGSVTVQNSSINAPSVYLYSGTTSGTLTVENSSITTSYLSLNSGDGILLNDAGSGVTLTGSGGSPQVSLTATNPAGVVTVGNTLNTTDFSAFTTVNMSAHTINLYNTNFGAGSTVNLTCFNGQLAGSPNTGAASQPGYVNFITGVTYGGAGNPAQFHVNFSAPGVGINIASGAP